MTHPRSPIPAPRQESSVLFIGMIAILCVGIFMFSKPLLRRLSAPPANTPASETSSTSSMNAEESLPFISIQDIWRSLEQGKEVVFFDIRPQEQFEQSHVPHSQLVTPETLEASLPQDQKTIFIVFSLNQADQLPSITHILTKRNIPHFFISGGFENLQKERYPLISFGDFNSLVDQSKVTFLTPEETRKYIDTTSNKVLFLDVRSEQDFALARIVGARNIPLSAIETYADSLPRSTMLLVYGTDKESAFQAAVRLSDLNFSLVRAVMGTPLDLEKAGVPAERGTAR